MVPPKDDDKGVETIDEDDDDDDCDEFGAPPASSHPEPHDLRERKSAPETVPIDAPPSTPRASAVSDESPDEQPSNSPPEEPYPSDRMIENRYTLLEGIGNGAQGDVWIAYDRIIEERVAFKWMHVGHDSHRARVRREIATLRMLRFPGVVKFIDEGVADGKPFIVMEFFPGRPFPGVDHIPDWQTIADTTLALLETLSQVHAAGVVHRDLKPDNVLVGADGRPGILDFGISHLRDPNLGPFTTKGIIGTPLYLAPEQILGREVDARTDLYALGLMLYEALARTIPHNHSDRHTIQRLRLTTPAPPIQDFIPNLPAKVATVINRLLAPRAEERFASAADVIAALRGESIPSHASFAGLELLRQSSGVVSENELVKLFDGPDRLLHLREDSARILWQRTSGNLELVEAELQRWVRLGLASRKGSVFAVNRISLDWLAAGPSGTVEERRLGALFGAGEVSDAARETIAIAEQRAIAGRLASATRVLADGLHLVRDHNATAEELAILTMLTKVALAEDTTRAFDRTLYELARAKVSHADVRKLKVLMQASLEASGARKAQALQALDELGPLRDPELERARHQLRIITVASRASAAQIAKMLEDVEAWRQRSGHPLAELTLIEGQARQRYHEGRFEDAANLYLRAATLETWTTARIDTMLRSASASMEAFRHDDATKTAEMARGLAKQSRHPYWEGRAEWVLRSVQYRTGNTTGPDMELIGAVERVGAEHLEALVCLNEAAAAMRIGEYDIARTLANRAATTWRHMERPIAMMFARALAIACGAPTDATEVQKLATLAMSCTVSGLGIQALGLLGRVYPNMRSSWQHAIEGLVQDVPRQHWHERMDILSIDEAMQGAT